jgi:DNA polymerase-3 subunit delta'
LSQRLLCSQANDGEPCGNCQDCKLFLSGTHPDFHVLTSEHESVNGRIDLVSQYSERYQDGVARDKKANPAQIIPVDQIRTLIDRFYQSSHISDSRVALVLPADRMNINASNALLKVLEEPPEGAFFVLVADQPGLLPSTIRSRCVLETLANPDAEAAKQWLGAQGANTEAIALADEAVEGPIQILHKDQSGELAQQQKNMNGLLAVMGGRQDPVELASAMSKQEILPLLQWMQQVLVVIIKWQSGGQAPRWSSKSGLDLASVPSAKLHAVYDKIGRYRSMARDQVNPQLALEELLIALQRALRT